MIPGLANFIAMESMAISEFPSAMAIKDNAVFEAMP
jgi:hypothetical protein